MSHIWDHAHWISCKILPHVDPSHLSVGQITRKLGFSASHWLYWPIRGLRHVSHVWDYAHWIPGKIQPMDPTCPVDDSGPQCDHWQCPGVSFSLLKWSKTPSGARERRILHLVTFFVTLQL